MAATKVQTGGFGDPNGVPANPNSTGKGTGNIAAVGSFDFPAGPGYGNGTGGARGARGVIAGTSFGNVVAPKRRSGQLAARVQSDQFRPAPSGGNEEGAQQINR